MPTYEYECKSCGSRFDVMQPITARPLRRYNCDACGAVRPVRRLLGAGGALIFRGSGFYTTDYRSESFKQAAKSESDTVAKKDADAAPAANSTQPKPAAAESASSPSPATAKPARAASRTRSVK